MKRIEDQNSCETEVSLLNEELVKLKQQIREIKKDQFLFNILLNNIPDVIFFKDAKGRLTRASQSMVQALNLTSEQDIIGKTDYDLHNVEHAEKTFKDEQRIMNTGKPIIDYEQMGIRKGGKVVWRSTTKMPLKNKNGEAIGTFGIARDITERKMAEIETKSKERFLANMSHELRTPMNAIIGLTESLLPTKMESRQHELLEVIQHSGKDLLAIINNILDLSKLHERKMGLRSTHFELKGILTSLTEAYKKDAEDKGLKLDHHINAEVPEVLLGDPEKLNQILSNIIDNAIKFTHKGHVNITCSLARQTKKKNYIKFKISDTGIGIKNTSRIFQVHQQEKEDGLEGFEGVGLGLAICKELVSLFRGKIEVFSEHGKGSEFCITLPFQTGEKQHLVEGPIERKPSSNRLKGKKILLVEDHDINQMVAIAALKPLGIEIDVAENGAESLKKLQEADYDLVLMDLQMPVMDGYEATRHIRNTLKLDIPIITMTADAACEEKEKCFELGMNDYISKPFKADLLAEKMTRLLEEKNGPDNGPVPIPKLSNSKKKHTKLYNLNNLPGVVLADKELKDKVIRIFIHNTPELERELKDHFDKNEIQRVREIAHKLKSSFDLFQVKKLQPLIRQMENLPENYNRSALKEKIVVIQDTTRQVVRQLKAELSV